MFFYQVGNKFKSEHGALRMVNDLINWLSKPGGKCSFNALSLKFPHSRYSFLELIFRISKLIHSLCAASDFQWPRYGALVLFTFSMSTRLRKSE